MHLSLITHPSHDEELLHVAVAGVRPVADGREEHRELVLRAETSGVARAERHESLAALPGSQNVGCSLDDLPRDACEFIPTMSLLQPHTITRSYHNSTYRISPRSRVRCCAPMSRCAARTVERCLERQRTRLPRRLRMPSWRTILLIALVAPIPHVDSHLVLQARRCVASAASCVGISPAQTTGTKLSASRQQVVDKFVRRRTMTIYRSYQ